MLRYSYEICQSDAKGPDQAWELKFNERHLGCFAALESALASAKSLQSIDELSGAYPTLDVVMPYGRFRVSWVDGAADAIQIVSVAELSSHGSDAGHDEAPTRRN